MSSEYVFAVLPLRERLAQELPHSRPLDRRHHVLGCDRRLGRLHDGGVGVSARPCCSMREAKRGTAFEYDALAEVVGKRHHDCEQCKARAASSSSQLVGDILQFNLGMHEPSMGQDIRRCSSRSFGATLV